MASGSGQATGEHLNTDSQLQTGNGCPHTDIKSKGPLWLERKQDLRALNRMCRQGL